MVPSLARRLASASLLRRLGRVDVLAERLRAAGWRASVEDLVATKIAAGVGSAFIVTAVGPRLFPLALMVGVGSFLLPDLVVARAARIRIRQADVEVPQFLDLLAASSSAGLAAPATRIRRPGR